MCQKKNFHFLWHWWCSEKDIFRILSIIFRRLWLTTNSSIKSFNRSVNLEIDRSMMKLLLLRKKVGQSINLSRRNHRVRSILLLDDRLDVWPTKITTNIWKTHLHDCAYASSYSIENTTVILLGLEEQWYVSYQRFLNMITTCEKNISSEDASESILRRSYRRWYLLWTKSLLKRII